MDGVMSRSEVKQSHACQCSLHSGERCTSKVSNSEEPGQASGGSEGWFQPPFTEAARKEARRLGIDLDDTQVRKQLNKLAQLQGAQLDLTL